MTSKPQRLSPSFSEYALYVEQCGCCIYCDREVPIERMTRDHFYPRHLIRQLRKRYTRSKKIKCANNKVLSCSECNLRKKHDLPTEEEHYRYALVYGRFHPWKKRNDLGRPKINQLGEESLARWCGRLDKPECNGVDI